MAIAALYRLNGNSNDAIAYDGSDVNVLYSQSYGKLNEGASYGGTAYSTMGNNLAFEYNQPWTITCWLKNNSTGASNIISKQNNSSPYQGYGIGTASDGKLQAFVFRLSNGAYVYNFPSTYADKLYYIAVTYSASNLAVNPYNFYVNAALVVGTQATNPVSFSASITTTEPFQLSGRSGANSLWNGYLDEVIINNSVLSIRDIKQRYLKYKGFF